MYPSGLWLTFFRLLRPKSYTETGQQSEAILYMLGNALNPLDFMAEAIGQRFEQREAQLLRFCAAILPRDRLTPFAVARRAKKSRANRLGVVHCALLDVCALRAATSKIAGSGSSKNAAWSERTASSASSSSIMKLMLISLAPCEIIRTLM